MQTQRFLRNLVRIRRHVTGSDTSSIYKVFSPDNSSNAVNCLEPLARNAKSKVLSSANVTLLDTTVTQATKFLFDKLYKNKRNDEAQKINDFQKLYKYRSHSTLKRVRNALIKKNSVSRLPSNQLKSEQTRKLMTHIYPVLDKPDFETQKGFRQVQDTFLTCLSH